MEEGGRVADLAMPALMTYYSAVSAREAIMHELKLAPESLVQEAYDFVLFLKSRKTHGPAEDGTQRASVVRPDFLARQKALFGGRVLADSQGIMDELRAERC